MNSTSFVIVYIFMPVVVFTVMMILGGKKPYWALAYLGCLVLGYGLLVQGARLMGAEAIEEFKTYDLNGDGRLSGEEITAEAEAAHRRVISDSGIAMIPVTGIPITLIWVSLWLTLIYWSGVLLRKLGLVRRFEEEPNQPPQTRATSGPV